MDTAHIPTSLTEAEALDAADPLGPARARFQSPEGETYLVGHSLGPLSDAARKSLDGALAHWRADAVGAWNTASWIDMPMALGARIAPLIGARAGEVVVCDSVSVNLFKLAGALAARHPDARIVVEAGEFPTDQYILERLAGVTGCGFTRAGAWQGTAHLAPGTVLVRSLVDYRTAEVADMAASEAMARAAGADIIWDLSHATGVLDLKLAERGARYAVGCTYKYLSGGPGAPAFLYVEGDLADALRSPVEGWLGHAQPFAFESDYAPAPGVERFVTGTPPILSMAALAGALDLFEGVDLALLEAKARRLGDMCLLAFARLGLPSGSPPVGRRRGGHVAFTHPQGYALSRALMARGVRCDFRTPDTIRFGLSPLTLSYAEVWRALATLEDVLENREFKRAEYQTGAKVT